MNRFRATVVQMTGTPFDVAGNSARIERHVRSAADDGTSLVVLPELCDTGYTLSPTLSQISSTIPGRISDFLSGLAAELNLTIVTAVSARTDPGRLQDVSIIVTPDGLVVSGAKRWLWGEESTIFTPGKVEDQAIADTPVARIGVAVCYEGGFPEAARRLALNGAQVIAVPSAFGRARLHAWKLLTRSRALENGCYLLAANNVGPSGGFEFAGHSTIVDPHGERIALLSDGEGVVTTDVYPTLVDEARTAIPYLKDLHTTPTVTV
jgi:predicted amidohydrolase